MFDLPIRLDNDISEERNITDCGALENPLTDWRDIDNSIYSLPFQPWVNGEGDGGNGEDGEGDMFPGAASGGVEVGRWAVGVAVVVGLLGGVGVL